MLCGGCKISLRHHLFYCYILSGPSGSMTPIHLVLRIKYRLSRCFQKLSWADSIKPSLQFSFLYFDLVAPEGSTFTRSFISIDNVICNRLIYTSTKGWLKHRTPSRTTTLSAIICDDISRDIIDTLKFIIFTELGFRSL